MFNLFAWSAVATGAKWNTAILTCTTSTCWRAPSGWLLSARSTAWSGHLSLDWNPLSLKMAPVSPYTLRTCGFRQGGCKPLQRTAAWHEVTTTCISSGWRTMWHVQHQWGQMLTGWVELTSDSVSHNKQAFISNSYWSKNETACRGQQNREWGLPVIAAWDDSGQC